MITQFTLLRSGADAGAPGIEGTADFDRGILTLELEGKTIDLSLGHARDVIGVRYYVPKPLGGWRADFSDEEKIKLRPMAETLAMLDGNAFFGNTTADGKEWYEMYLPEASALYEANGGDGGWAGASHLAGRRGERAPAA